MLSHAPILDSNMQNIVDIVGLLAGIVVIVSTPFFCWASYRKLDEESVKALKSKLKIAWWWTTLTLGTVVFSGALIFEINSDSPLNKEFVIRVVAYSFLLLFWIALHFVQVLLVIIRSQNSIMDKHLDITKHHTNVMRGLSSSIGNSKKSADTNK